MSNIIDLSPHMASRVGVAPYSGNPLRPPAKPIDLVEDTPEMHRTEQPKPRAEHGWERRERLASRDQEMVQRDINRHVTARRAYGQALARVTAIEDGNLPVAQIAEANLKAYEAYTEMTEAARMLLVVMPTDLKALIDLMLYLEKNFSLLPPDIACGASNGQSLAFTLLQTVRLSLREIAKYGKRGAS